MILRSTRLLLICGLFICAIQICCNSESVAAVNNYIIPQPQQLNVRINEKPFRITSTTKIVINDNADKVDMWTINELNSTLVKYGMKRLDVIHSFALGSDPQCAVNVILIGESASNRLLHAVCDNDSVKLPVSPYETGVYIVDATQDRIVIVGSSPVNTYYGVQTFKQLIRKDACGSIYISAVNIKDYPRFQFRGVHLLTAKDSLNYISKLIENVLAPLKINNIVLQTDKIAWTSHPELTDENNFMPYEDVPKLVEFAKRYHIDITPLVESPGHLEWAFRSGNNNEIAEDPKHPYCYCMSNQKSYDFIYSVMDEAIELFGHPEYFHAGRDEFDMRGVMPYDARCKEIGKEKLYIDDTIKIYEHLKSKGCKMMMWGDVLTKPNYADMVDKIPKDILINDWRYKASSEYPTIDFYKSHGFQVVGATWYKSDNISTLSNYASQKGILGMLQTTWTGWVTEEKLLGDKAFQIYPYILSAAWSWNPEQPKLNKLPYHSDKVFLRLWNGECTELNSDSNEQYTIKDMK